MLRAVERVFLWEGTLRDRCVHPASMVVASHEGEAMLGAWMVAGLTAQAADLSTVLHRHVDEAGRVAYSAAATDEELEAVVTALATAAVPADRAGKMAFWINAYNVLTVDLVADHWPLESIRDLDGGNPWDARTFTVAGKSVTLNDIEHKILRPMGDPRIHAAVNCASLGCPPLATTAFTATGLDAELDAASRRWAQSTGATIDRKTGVVSLSKIFDWYGDDFVAGATGDIPGVDGKRDAALQFLARHLPTEDASWVMTGGYSVRWAPYSWKVNAR